MKNARWTGRPNGRNVLETKSNMIGQTIYYYNKVDTKQYISWQCKPSMYKKCSKDLIVVT